MNYINNCLSTEDERRQLSDIFKYLDKNNDGVLSFDELVDGYTGVYSRCIA
jgi:Ca2+-binding EF-hand superfamily protein